MNKKMVGLLAALFTFATFTFAQSNDPILLIVGKDTVTKSQFLETYKKNNQLEKATEKDLREYLNLYTVFKLKVNEGRALQVDTSVAFKRELASYRNQSAKPYLIDKEVTDHLIDEAAEHSKYNLRAAHLLVKCQSESPKDTLEAYKKAMKIRKEILGGLSFADAAVKYSDDPSARDMENPQTKRIQVGNKGELGYFTAFNFIYPFEVGAYKTKVGEVSMPVRSNFGYHLIYVTDKVPAMKQISIAQIFISDSLAKEQQMLPTTAAKLERIQARLQEGALFADLVKDYSDDQGSVSKGGELQPFAPQRRTGDFVKACISIKPGEYSKPVASQNGWHIVKLIEIEYVDFGEDFLPMLKNRINRDMRSHKSKDMLVEKLKKEYNYNEKNKKAVFDYLAANLPAEYFQSTRLNIEELDGLDKQKPVFTFADQQVSARDFAKFIARFQGVAKQGAIMEFLNEKFPDFVKEVIMRYENNHLEAKYPEFKNLVTEYHEGMILYEVTSNEVWLKAVRDTTGLEQFYVDNKAKYPVSNTDTTPKTFEEAKASVITDYQNYLEENWVKKLREKYPIFVSEEVFATILKK